MQRYAEAGFELAFFGLEVKCSTNWAMRLAV